MLFTAAGEEAEPEGRAFRLGPEFGNPLCAELWTKLPDELNTFIGFQWAEIDGRHSLFAQILDQGVLEGQSPTGRPGGGDDGERYFLFRSRADQVRAQRQREVIDPLEVIGDEQDRT